MAKTIKVVDETKTPPGYKKCPQCGTNVKGPRTAVCPECQHKFTVKAQAKKSKPQQQPLLEAVKPEANGSSGVDPAELFKLAGALVAAAGSAEVAQTVLESYTAVTNKLGR